MANVRVDGGIVYDGRTWIFQEMRDRVFREIEVRVNIGCKCKLPLVPECESVISHRQQCRRINAL
jgi:hypothetical protein